MLNINYSSHGETQEILGSVPVADWQSFTAGDDSRPTGFEISSRACNTDTLEKLIAYDPGNLKKNIKAIIYEKRGTSRPCAKVFHAGCSLRKTSQHFLKTNR